MATTMDSSAWVEEAFLLAKNEFLQSLANKSAFDFSKLVSADDVLRAALAIQQEQAATKTFRGLARIRPLITVLQDFGGVVDTFVQVKPDVLGLIWGPLKFILQAASTLTSAFEKIVKTLGEIQLVLPGFKKYGETFPRNDIIRQILLLFFEDILRLYSVLLNFATNSKLRIICEPFWPSVRAKVDQIREHIQSHQALMTEVVTLEDIVRAQQARNMALTEYDRAQKFRDHQAFCAIRDEINPEICYERLGSILRQSNKGSGSWLDKEQTFMNWLDPADRTARCLWLSGIPGAGKTFLAGNIIQRLQRTGQCVLFVFLSHEDHSPGKLLSVLHSLLFQALEHSPSLQVLLPEYSSPDRRKLLRDQDFVRETLCTILTSLGPVYIVLDGLDEIEESCWRDLLAALFGIKESCAEAKVHISSREAREISLALKDRVAHLRIDKQNYGDIQAFVHREMEVILLQFDDADDTVRSKIQAALKSIAVKSDGMFLYAQLVLHIVKDYGTAEEIQAVVEDLPDGLYKAYGRLISRIEQKASRKLQVVIRRILMWIACATRPLREEELLQALVIVAGDDAFTRGQRDYRDIRRDCGPIIEVLEGTVRFVHFSAKEYLLHEQSNKFIKLVDAHLDISLTCATYLSFPSLDSLLSATSESAEIQRQILRGDFVLLEYAALGYMDHIKEWMANKTSEDPIEGISTALDLLFVIRQNHLFDLSTPSKSFVDEFEVFQADQRLQHQLASASSFVTGIKIGMVDVDESTGTSPGDPLSILPTLVQFRRRLEDMVCDGPDHSPGCSCPTLKKLYGPRLYHCRKPFCSAYTSGFETKKSLTEHTEMHTLGYRCSFAGCMFASIGFRSSDELSRHVKSTHETLDMPDQGISSSEFTALPEGDQEQLFYDAVANGHFDAVQRLANPSVLEKCNYFLKSGNYAITLAGWCSPPDIISWLLDHEYFRSSLSAKMNEALHAAIEGENLPNIKLLLSRGANIRSNVALYTLGIAQFTTTNYNGAAISGVLRALRRWNVALMKFLVEECGVTIPHTWDGDKSQLGCIFGAAHLSDATLEDASCRFSAMKSYIPWPEAYAVGPYFAVSSGSPVLVKISLENGGDPNAHPLSKYSPLDEAVNLQDNQPWLEIMELLLEYKADPIKLSGGKSLRSVLEKAAYWNGNARNKKSVEFLLRHGADPNVWVNRQPIYAAVSRGQAELVKLLLQKGADPDESKRRKNIEDSTGMKKVEKYFGIPWKDIVRRIQAGEDLKKKDLKGKGERQVRT